MVEPVKFFGGFHPFGKSFGKGIALASGNTNTMEIGDGVPADVSDVYKRQITDWPFENFWGNPHEPRHSKLLGYFIDPLQKHDCDYFLRRKLLEVLENALKASECLPPVPRLFPPMVVRFMLSPSISTF